jgi:hypothetical protein
MRLGVLVAVAATAGVVAAAVMGSGAAGTATATLTPVADSYVRADRPMRNFGKASGLSVAGRPVSNAYLRFRVTVPAGKTVTRATLQLFASSRSTTGFTVHRVADTTWGETTITYANAPAIRARVAASGAHRGKAYASVDVTSLVTRSGLVSFAVKGVSPSPLGFMSREAGSGRPRLVVETSDGGAVAPKPTLPATTSPAAAPSGGRACGTVTAPPPRFDHVIWIFMENKPYDAVIGSPSAPFENALAAACGLATNYHSITHPSLPNYVAATSGSTQGITDDGPPSSHPLDVASIYSQVKAAGKTWRDYAETAASPCPLIDNSNYAVKHDPAAYYTGIRSDCAVWDVPMGTPAGGNFLNDLTAGTLPAFSFVVPDLCSDTHSCSIETGDAWLGAWFAKILASPAYLTGRTVIFLTWDEDDGSVVNRVPLIVVSPSTPAGTRSGTFFDHYSLLKTTEQLLGIGTFLGHAADASSMVSTFNLG